MRFYPDTSSAQAATELDRRKARKQMIERREAEKRTIERNEARKRIIEGRLAGLVNSRGARY